MTSPAQTGSGAPPVPVGAASIDDLTSVLRELRAWAGTPSYATLAQRVAKARLTRGVPRSEAVPGRVTVYDCFRRRRWSTRPDRAWSVVGRSARRCSTP